MVQNAQLDNEKTTIYYEVTAKAFSTRVAWLENYPFGTNIVEYRHMGDIDI